MRVLSAPVPKIQTYTTPAGVDAFVKDAAVTKAGTTLTYGPFSGVPASASGAFAITHQRAIAVQYGYDSPVLEVRTLRRWAEVSHWGANLNVQDELALHNAGPTLKGHFSRLEHQSQKFYGKLAPHVVPQLTLHLPAGLRDAYYYDIIGNVSTSNLRAAPRGSAAPSVLELRPRYPLLGGWNYSFTLGWDADLGDAARYDAASGRYVLAVPIMAPLPGAAVQRAELTIVLPEGAADVRLATPFPPVAMMRETHSTYLDSAGRPALTLEYAHLTDKHAGVVYVSYGVSAPAHVRKVGTVAVALFSIFVLAMGARRVDLSLARKK
jgi:oligosaccharyltransferase complex subunit alpha (ribophorin I)